MFQKLALLAMLLKWKISKAAFSHLTSKSHYNFIYGNIAWIYIIHNATSILRDIFSISFQAFGSEIQYKLYQFPFVPKMNEYEQNMYLNDVFDILALNYGEISYPLLYQQEMQNMVPFNSLNQKKLNQQKVLQETVAGTYEQKTMNNVINISRIKMAANWIQCTQFIKNKNREIFQGGKDDTMHLNINFKTIIVNYFKELLQVNQLSYIQVKKLADFGRRSPSLQSLAVFCEGREEQDQIREKCLNFLESSMFICRILESKCRMAAKIRMIKFAQKLRMNLSSKSGVIKWKSFRQL